MADELIQAFENARLSGNKYPNIDEQRLHCVAKAFDINVTLAIIYQILD